MKNKKILLIILSIILLIDQLSKIIILNTINEIKVIIPKLLEIEVIKNIGIAFGLNDGNLKNIFITMIILIIIINFIIKQQNNIDKKMTIALSLILGGGISNLIDRIIRGGVVDFIKVSTFQIFNIADISIVIGWILLIICVVNFGINKEMEEVKKWAKELRY